MAPLLVCACPFVDLPNAMAGSHWGTGIAAADMSSFRWVKPRLVAEVSFVEWTRESVLRHPRFVGLRTDKRPTGHLGRRRRALVA